MLGDLELESNWITIYHLNAGWFLQKISDLRFIVIVSTDGIFPY
jgi:hypothetical protein